MTKVKKPKIDPYKGLKYLGYRLSQLPETYRLSDLVRVAKFQLAAKTRTLLKDPIWDQYTVEELLIEFYAHQFQDSKEARTRFEMEVAGDVGDFDDFADWADKKMAEDAKIREKTLNEMEESVSFSPSQVMGDDT